MRRIFETSQEYSVTIPRHPILQTNVTHNWTVRTSLEIEDLIEKTKYGEQLCTIGTLIEKKPCFEEDFVKAVVVRRVIHPLEMKNIDSLHISSNDLFLTPCMRYRDDKEDAFFLASEKEMMGGYKFEMTFGWYMKRYKIDAKDGFSLESVLISGPDDLWGFSETFKKFLGGIIKDVDKMHGMACTHGDLSANNIIVSSSWHMYNKDYKVNLLNCLQKHDLDKEEEKKLFEARMKKDWEAVLKLVFDATNGIDGCFNYELTHFLNKLKTLKEKDSTLNKASFDHPVFWLRDQKEFAVKRMDIKFIAKKMSKLGFLEPGVDWRKLVHENILAESKEGAEFLGLYREDYNGEYNDSILDLLFFIRDSYNSLEYMWITDKLKKWTGYSAMDLYLQSVFPDFFVKLHQLERTNVCMH